MTPFDSGDGIVRHTELRRQFTPDAREIRLTKGDAARATAPEMREFQGLLSLWASLLGGQGYRIDAVPEEGPGTMVWRAVSPAEQVKERLG